MDCPLGVPLIAGLWLQWSRFFSKRKILRSELPPPRQILASMEPLFFKAENFLDYTKED